MSSMDVWQIISYLNVFFVLVEYCLVLWLSKATPLEGIALNKVFPKEQMKKNVSIMTNYIDRDLKNRQQEMSLVKSLDMLL